MKPKISLGDVLIAGSVLLIYATVFRQSQTDKAFDELERHYEFVTSLPDELLEKFVDSRERSSNVINQRA